MLKNLFSPAVRKEIATQRKIGLPIIIAQLLLMSITVVDTIMAGNFSSNALAAVAVGSSTMLPIYIFLLGVLMAVTPMVAQNSGARKLGAIGLDVRQALILSQFLALIFFVITRELSIVMELIGLDEALIPIADGYLDAYSWGAFPAFAYLVLRFFNDGLGNTVPAMWIAAIGLVVNIPANYVLIYGKFGFPELGAVGCGWASSIVGFVLFGSMAAYTALNPAFKRFEIFKKFRLEIDWKVIKELFKIGTPIGFTSTMEVTAFAAVSLIMARLGTETVAAHQIAINIAAVVYMIPFGLSMAITTRVGQAIGASKYNEAKFRGNIGIMLSMGIMVFSAIFLYTTRDLLIAVYTDDVAVTAIASGLLLLAAIFQLSDGLQVAGYGALKGLKDTTVPMLVNFVAYWIIGIPIGAYLGLTLEMGPTGLWIGLICGLSVAAVLHNLRFKSKMAKLIAKMAI
jgi:MATE family multidrug resistance protein